MEVRGRGCKNLKFSLRDISQFFFLCKSYGKWGT
jgi:hypothetical protein